MEVVYGGQSRLWSNLNDHDLKVTVITNVPRENGKSSYAEPSLDADYQLLHRSGSAFSCETAIDLSFP